MKILLVQPSAGFLMRGTTYPVCRSIMTTASYMKSIGHEVLVFDRCIDFRKAEKIFDSFRPELVTVFVPPTASFKDAVKITSLAKERSIPSVWCEVVAAAFSETLVETGNADFVITGETESKLESLINQLCGKKNFDGISGLTYLKDGKSVSNQNANNSPLGTMPEIDWEMIDVEKCFRQFPHCKKMLYMYTSRGCPFKCGYCYNTMFYNSQHRKRPIRYVLSEIEKLEKNHGLDGVNFSDELLLLSDEEIDLIASFRKEKGLKFVWGGETRADTYRDFQTLKKMYDAGCRWFMLGIETGSDKTREIINKPMSRELIKEFVDKCTDVGITTFGSFIIGFPGETQNQLRETVQFAQSLNLDAFLFNYYIAIPKTPLYSLVKESGKYNFNELLDTSSIAQEIQSLTKNYSDIPDKELKVIKSWFDWMTFTRKKKEASEKGMFIRKAIDTAKHFAEGNIKNSVQNIYSAVQTFLTVIIYSFCFPKIKKKYGLKNINKKI